MDCLVAALLAMTACYCAVTPAFLMTGTHLSISLATCWARYSGVCSASVGRMMPRSEVGKFGVTAMRLSVATP